MHCVLQQENTVVDHIAMETELCVCVCVLLQYFMFYSHHQGLGGKNAAACLF